jgi:RHS repeat-associated protein
LSTDILTQGAIVKAKTFNYNLDGELLRVSENGNVTEEYTYDANSNRTLKRSLASVGAAGGGSALNSETATYNSQDRMVSQGNNTFSFDADGFLQARTNSFGTDTFNYSAKGELLTAKMATGSVVSYMYDSNSRLIGRTHGGETSQFVYANLSSPYQFSASKTANVTTFYFYDTLGNLMGFERSGQRYSVLTDLVGTPRIVKSLEYTSFGELLSDSNEGFELLVGFASGIVDEETSLVKFGFRDYDPSSGRWTARDPILFEGGQGNLYVYVGNSPCMTKDPDGLDAVVTEYKGEGPNVAGHVGVAVNSKETKGFYPVKNSSGADMATGQNIPGNARPDNYGAARKTVVIKTTPEQDKKMQEYIDDRAKNPGHYNLYERNCSHFTQGVLNAAGIKTSGTMIPKWLIKELGKK